MNKILALPGDGIGPSVIGSAVEVIGAVADDIEFVSGDIGFSAYEASGQYLPFETMDLAGECGTILCGPVRTVTDDKGNSKDPLETLKIQLDLYAMVRRFTTMSPDLGTDGLDITLWGSNTIPGRDIVETRDIDGITLNKYVRSSSYCRMMGRALSEIEVSGRKRISCITRGDLFPESSNLFEESFDSLFGSTDMDAKCINVSKWASDIVRNPLDCDSVICADLYTHVAAGILAGLTGGNHLSPLGFAGDSNYLLLPGNIQTFEEIPKEYANPTSAIMAGAMALIRMNRKSASDNIVNALRETYREGGRTPDVGGEMTTEQFTMAVIGHLQ